MMEEENVILKDADIDVEDFDFSDVDESDPTAISLNIDSNSRVVSKLDSKLRVLDNSENNFGDNENNRSTFQLRNLDVFHQTSSEEYEVSDEDSINSASLALKNLSVDGAAYVGVTMKRKVNSSPTFLNPSAFLKDECLTDAEYISEDEMDSDLGPRQGLLNGGLRKLSGGLSVGGFLTKDALSPKANTLSTKNAARCSSSKYPLMTCIEFLKSKMSDDEATDTEELCMESNENSEDGIHPVLDLDNMPKNSIGCDAMNVLDDTIGSRRERGFLDQYTNRKSSWTTELLYDDESPSDQRDVPFSHTRKRKQTNKRPSNSGDYNNDSSTDEEIIDFSGKEWTEVDDSGCVRQITHIKTETSIKLEDAVKSLKKVPERTPSDSERKSSTDSEQDDLSFTEKKSYFHRLSLTSNNLPTDKWTKDVSLDDLPMAEGEIVNEQISFEDKLKMFEPDEGNRKKIQKRDKQEQPTVYRYDFTKNGKEKASPPDFSGDLESVEEIVKQVNEELAVEEDNLNESGFDAHDRDYIPSDSAISLEKVEQEVYSLVAEVDKEERELSRDYDYVYEANKSFEKEESPKDDSFQTESFALNEDHTMIGDILDMERESVVPEMIGEAERYASQCEVEGEGSALDSDGLVSTTTTRVVTSVITDPDAQSEIESTFMQQLSDDDIKQSCEISVNEVITDSSASHPGFDE